MRHFDELHPVVLGIYFMAVILPVMVAPDFKMAMAALATALAMEWFTHRKVPFRQFGTGIVIVAVMMICNGIFSHKGTTELFFINGRAVTLESLKYGAVTGIMMAAVIFWFDIFSGMMTSDKIMVIFGRMPRTALVISMILRLVPEYAARFSKVKEAQKANHGEEGESRNGILKISSAVFTWALEKSMQTADSIIRRNGEKCSMVRKRKFKGRDVFVLLAVLSVQACYFAPDAFHFAVIMFLGMLPLIWEGKEYIKWQFYSSKKQNAYTTARQ